MNERTELSTANTPRPDDAPADLTTRIEPVEGSDAKPPEGELPGGLAGSWILEVIAQGGMGIVYRAHDLALNRLVAVKVLQERFRHSSSSTARFIEEAQITAQLQHPGIPPVHQVGTLPDGRPFLAMKLIKG